MVGERRGLRPAAAYERLRTAGSDGRLTALCHRHGLTLVVIFGSVVKGSAAPRDVDIAVAHDHARPLDLLGLVNDLIDLAGTDVIDVLNLNRAGAVARSEALVHGVVIFDAYSGLAATLQMSATTERQETAGMRRWDLELLAMGS